MSSIDAPHTLVVTTEHAATGKMGGIGSYNAETQMLAPGVLFLLVDDSVVETPDSSIIPCGVYVAKNFPSDVSAYADTQHRGYIILKTVLDILQSHPTITQVATHEYAGIGARIAEAARTGCFPDNVKVRVHCHGGHVQLERATDTWLGPYLDTLNAERSSIENADDVWFPGTYLHELYRAAGMRMQPNRVRFLGLPYRLTEGVKTSREPFTTITNIAFIGRMNKLKGYGIFAEVVEDILHEASPFRDQIKTITAIGNDDGSMSSVREKTQELIQSTGGEYIQTLKTRDDTLAYIREHVTDTLFLLPYFSDNYSVAMLEIIDAGAPLLVLNTGGNTELIHDTLWTQGRIADDTEHLKEKARYYMGLSASVRQEECEKLRGTFAEEQTVCNDEYRKLFTSTRWSRRSNSGAKTQIKLAYVYVGKDEQHLPKTWYFLNEHTGDQDKVFDDRPTHVFLSRTEITYDSSDLSKTLEVALHTGGAGGVYTLGFSNGGEVGLLRNGSLGQFIEYPQGLMLTNVCVPIELYESIAQRFSKRRSLNRTGREFFFAAISYALYAQNVRIIPVPKLVGRASSAILPIMQYDNMIFADFAHLQENPQWESFRYTAILKYHQAENQTEAARLFNDYRHILLAHSKAGRLARKLIRFQLRLVVAAKKVASVAFRR